MEINYERYPRGDARHWSTVEEIRRPMTTEKSQEDVSLFSNTPRKQLENYFTASLMALAILFTTLLISIFIASKPDLFNNICQTPHCIHSAAMLLDAMNMSVNPCDDFYQFACGNWKADYPADMKDEFFSLHSWTTEQSIKQKEVLIGHLREENAKDDPSGVRAARRVFKACQNMAVINTVGLASLWTILEKLGLPRYPSNVTGKNLQWSRSLGRVARYLGSDLIVGLSVTPSVHNSSVNQITLFSPEDSGNAGIFGGWMMKEPSNKMKSTSSTNFHQWETYASGIIKYLFEAGGEQVEDDAWLTSLAKSILKVFTVINEAVRTDNYPKYIVAATPIVMGIAEFQKTIDNSSNTGLSKLQISAFLEEMVSDFPELNVDFSKEMLKVYRLEYYRSLSLLLGHVNEQELELFIWWKVVYLLAAHVNEDLMYLKDKMVRNLSDGKYPALSRETFCYYNVIQLMQPSLGYFVMKDLQQSKIGQSKYKQGNYRGISLLFCAYKVLSNILFQRLLPYAEREIGKYQVGFMRGRSTIDQIFSFRVMLERAREYRIQTHHLFVDFPAAYDSMRRQELYEAMQNMGIPPLLDQRCIDSAGVNDIADNIKSALISSIRNQEWMNENSRRASVQKVQAVKFFIGVPEWMKNASNFDELYRSRGEHRPGIKDGQIPLYEFKHLENLQTLIDFAVKKMIGKIRSINSKTDEDFDPTLINAYYSTDINAVTIPYALLDLPILGWENEALNYGSIGAFLSHELNHGFDITGRMYDKNGNLQSWWSNSTLLQHDKRVSCFVNQYSNFSIPYFNSSLKLDGNRTLHENLADNGGLKIAFHAYKLHMNRHPPELKLPGLQEYSHEQLFFLAFARAKCSKYTKNGLPGILEDVHSPDFVRVLATLRNSLEFSSSWKCPKGGSYMNPVNKCYLWS